MLNEIIVQGRLCNDPDFRYIPSGQIPVATFTLACDRDRAKDGGQTADFFDVVAYRKTAEFADRWLLKGRMVIVTGRAQVRAYKDKEGSVRRVFEIVADSIYFGDSRKDESAPVDEPPSPPASNPSASAPSAPPLFAPPPFLAMDDEPGELPF